MQLAWSSTGDTLNIVVETPDVIEYWLDKVNQANRNSFELTRLTRPDENYTSELASNLQLINHLLVKFKIDPLMDHSCDWLDQNNLNVLHERWVKLQHKHKIIELLSKFQSSVLRKFHDINHLIHRIERPSELRYTNGTDIAWQTDNPFSPDILQFGTWQAEIHYQNLGRSTFEKWLNYDDNLVDTDTNNFTQLGGQLSFNLGRPVRNAAPYEYVEFCKQHNIKPYGYKLPIGNFKESITTLRHVFYRNVQAENNRISFTL